MSTFTVGTVSWYIRRALLRGSPEAHSEQKEGSAWMLAAQMRG